MKIHRFNIGTSMQMNAYICYDEETGQAVLIDPGFDDPEIARKTDELNLRPIAILLTHGHFDHIGGSDALCKRYGIKAHAHGLEAKLAADPAENGGMYFFRREITAKAEGDLHDGQKIEIGQSALTVIGTPGHTAGSLCFHSAADKFLVSGDTLFRLGVGRTDFPSGSQDDLRESINAKLMSLPDDTKVFPGHGAETTIGFERERNGFVGK